MERKKIILDTVYGMEEHTFVEIRGRRTTAAETNTVVAVRLLIVMMEPII